MTLAQLDALPVAERLARYAEDAKASLKCASCGGSVEDCSDSERDWFSQRTICYKAMERAAANAKYDERHKTQAYHDGTFPTDLAGWATERSASHPYHARDGVTIWVHETDLNPEDDFLGG